MRASDPSGLDVLPRWLERLLMVAMGVVLTLVTLGG